MSRHAITEQGSRAETQHLQIVRQEIPQLSLWGPPRGGDLSGQRIQCPLCPAWPLRVNLDAYPADVAIPNLRTRSRRASHTGLVAGSSRPRRS